jgi:hypothetical protein
LVQRTVGSHRLFVHACTQRRSTLRQLSDSRIQTCTWHRVESGLLQGCCGTAILTVHRVNVYSRTPYPHPTIRTWCSQVTPAHDPNDFKTGKRHNLEFINVFDDNGLVNDKGGPFAGQPRFKVRACTPRTPTCCSSLLEHQCVHVVLLVLSGPASNLPVLSLVRVSVAVAYECNGSRLMTLMRCGKHPCRRV